MNDYKVIVQLLLIVISILFYQKDTTFTPKFTVLQEQREKREIHTQ